MNSFLGHRFIDEENEDSRTHQRNAKSTTTADGRAFHGGPASRRSDEPGKIEFEPAFCEIFILTTCVVMMFLRTPGGDQALEIPARFLWAAIMIGSLVRFGLLCSAVVLFVSNLIFFTPTTLDPSSFFFGRSLIVIFIVVLIAGYGFYRSLGSQPLFAEVILDD